MSEASPRSSSAVLPAKISVAWGSTLLDVRHVLPGDRYATHDFQIEATPEGTRVLSDGEVLLAAGAGERVTKTLGGLAITIEPPGETERVRHDAQELDVRFFKITTIALLIFAALVASFTLTPLDGLTDGDIFGDQRVKLTIAIPPVKTIAKRVDAFKKKDVDPSATRPSLLEPKAPSTPQEKKAQDKAKVQNLVASMFGGSFDRVMGTGANNAIDEGLNNLKGPNPGADATGGLAGMGSRGTGPGGPAGGGLSIGGFGGPRPSGSPTGFGLNPGKKQTFFPGDGPKQVLGDGLPRDVIMAVIRRHQSEIKFCYERELQQNAKLAGKIAVSFTIDGSGNISEAQVAESGLDNANVESCMLERIRRWKFPEPQGGGVVVVTFPWVFSAAGADE